MGNLSWQGWSKTQLTYSHKIGSGSAWSVTGSKSGIIGGGNLLLIEFKAPTVALEGNLPIYEYGGVQVKLACPNGSSSGTDFRAYLFESGSSGSAPSVWRDRIATNTGISAMSSAPVVGVDSANSYNTYDFIIGGQVAANTTYYICVATNVDSSQRLTLVEQWYPEIWIEVSTTPLKLTYYQFNTEGTVATLEQVAGSYKALDPASYTWGSAKLKKTWIDNDMYFATWCKNPPQYNGESLSRRDGDRIAAGATFQFTTDTNLYPLGGKIESFDLTVEEGEPAKKILIAPYYGNTQYALESNTGTYQNSGVAFDIPKSLVTNQDLEKRLLYVQQDGDWHLLNGPFESTRGGNYLTYSMSGRGSNQQRYYKTASANYEIPLIMLDERSIDLASSYFGWRIGNNYRNSFSNYATISGSDLKGFNSLSVAQYLKLNLPVYKIQLQTFGDGVTDAARAGCSNVSNSYWITSIDENKFSDYFNYPEYFVGLKSNDLYWNSSSSNTATSMIQWTENNDGVINLGDTVVKTVSASSWQKFNKGNLSNTKLTKTNVYNVIYKKENITINTTNTTYLGTIIWVGTNPYIFAQEKGASVNLSAQTWLSNETKVRPTGFLYWKYNGKQYATLSALASSAFTDLINDSAPQITAVIGDSKGFVYIKDSTGNLKQYYIYVKDSDDKATLTRCTPYVKKQSWSDVLTPLIFNASGVAEKS